MMDLNKLPKLTVSATPHIRSKVTTQSIMRDVIIALLPAAVMGIALFGPTAALLIVISVASSVFFEAIYCKLAKKPSTIGDLSAAVTGLLLAMNLPASAPWWVPVVGSFVAIILAKQLFGGIGFNFVNPALAGRRRFCGSRMHPCPGGDGDPVRHSRADDQPDAGPGL